MTPATSHPGNPEPRAEKEWLQMDLVKDPERGDDPGWQVDPKCTPRTHIRGRRRPWRGCETAQRRDHGKTLALEPQGRRPPAKGCRQPPEREEAGADSQSLRVGEQAATALRDGATPPACGPASAQRRDGHAHGSHGLGRRRPLGDVFCRSTTLNQLVRQSNGNRGGFLVLLHLFSGFKKPCLLVSPIINVTCSLY